MPSIRCEPFGPPDITADSAGSAATPRRFGLCARKTLATPLSEWAEPTACTYASTLPAVCCQISSPIAESPAAASGLLLDERRIADSSENTVSDHQSSPPVARRENPVLL